MKTIEKDIVLKLLDNDKVTTIEIIREYLDYINRLHYSVEEVSLILEELKKEGKVRSQNQLWYKV